MAKLKELVNRSIEGMKEEVKEILSLLYDLSEEKARSFEKEIYDSLRIAGTIENPTIPIIEILASYQEIRVITKKTEDKHITDGIGEAVKKIISEGSDNIINGITGLIDTELRDVLRVAKGEERLGRSYYIATEGFSVIRLDLVYWCRNISAESVMEYAEKSLVCVVMKSIVDMSKVSFNEFLSTYQKQLSRCNLSIEQLKEDLRNVQSKLKEYEERRLESEKEKEKEEKTVEEEEEKEKEEEEEEEEEKKGKNI